MGERDKRERYRSRSGMNQGDYRGDFGPEGARRFNRDIDERDRWAGAQPRRTEWQEHAPREDHHNYGHHGPDWESRRSERGAGAAPFRRPGRGDWEPHRGYGAGYDAWGAGEGFRPAGFGFGPEEGPGPGGIADEDWQVTRPARGRGQWAGDWEDADRRRSGQWHSGPQSGRGERFVGAQNPRGGENFAGGENYRGRGPKGYRRNDDRIREEVCERLTDDWSVDASEISVSVQEGEVTLSGFVPSRDQKWRAEQCIEQLGGVRDVINELRVSREGASNERPERGGTSDRPSVAADRSK